MNHTMVFEVAFESGQDEPRSRDRTAGQEDDGNSSGAVEKSTSRRGGPMWWRAPSIIAGTRGRPRGAALTTSISSQLLRCGLQSSVCKLSARFHKYTNPFRPSGAKGT